MNKLREVKLYLVGGEEYVRVAEVSRQTVHSLEQFLSGDVAACSKHTRRLSTQQAKRIDQEYGLTKEYVQTMLPNGRNKDKTWMCVNDKDVIFSRLCEKYPEAKKYSGYHELFLSMLNEFPK